MNIKPSAAIRQNYNEIAELCRSTGEPVYLTKNGEGTSKEADGRNTESGQNAGTVPFFRRHRPIPQAVCSKLVSGFLSRGGRHGFCRIHYRRPSGLPLAPLLTACLETGTADLCCAGILCPPAAATRFDPVKICHLPALGFTFAGIFGIITTNTPDERTGAMISFQPLKDLYHWVDVQSHRIPAVPRNLGIMALFLCAAYYASSILITHTGGENNSALVFVLAVAMISLLTSGYAYGIAASIIGALCINIYFMEPYDAFSLSRTGYPVAMLSMVAVSCMVCALTARVKKQATEAVRREKKAKALYEQNERLNAEKAAIQLESERAAIRENILRAVSHDLRTPLTSISGTVSVLLETPEVSPKNLAMLSDIKQDADSLIVMVENLLSVTRVQDGTMPLKMREEMLEEVAGDALLTTRRRFPDCRVELDRSEDILYLPMDPLLVKQVIVNLLENAIRHSGDPEHITLRLYRQEDWAVVEVRDRGRGLSPEVYHAVKAGRPMPRSLSGDSTRGMGIGLSVCQNIIKAHGGFFTAENHIDGGAVFRFGLPTA